MISVRIARAVARTRPAAVRLPLQRRGYADAVSDKIKLTLALPHQVLKIFHCVAGSSEVYVPSLKLTQRPVIVNLQIYGCVRP
jgi:hypothetical protein